MSHGTSLATKGRLFRGVENASRGVIFSGAVIPTLLTVSPDHAMQGETVQITMTGNNLNGVIGIDFGADIIVDAPTTKTKTEIVVIIRISASAAIGYRDVTVTSAKGSSTLVNGFQVLKLVGPPQTGGGAGGLKGALVPHVIIRRRKQFTDMLTIKVQKDDSVEYDISVNIAKRIEEDQSLALGVSQTLSDALMLILAVDKPVADLVTAQILQAIQYDARNVIQGLLALAQGKDQVYEIEVIRPKKQADFVTLEVVPQAGYKADIKQRDVDVEPLPPPEAHTLSNEEEYNGLEGKLFYTGGEDHEFV